MKIKSEEENKHLSLFGTFGRNGSRNLSEKAGNTNFMSPHDSNLSIGNWWRRTLVNLPLGLEPQTFRNQSILMKLLVIPLMIEYKRIDTILHFLHREGEINVYVVTASDS